MSKKRNVQRGLAPSGLFGGAPLRDQMAMAALPLAWQSEHAAPTHGKEPTYLGVAERSYLLADAMLKARDVAAPPNTEVGRKGAV